MKPTYIALPMASPDDNPIPLQQDAPLLATVLADAAKIHPTTDECDDPECLICGYRDCPFHEPLHYHHDGCPACSQVLDDIVAVLVKDLPVANKVANSLLYKVADDLLRTLVSKGHIRA